MKKEFIPYEQALALKELGFDEPCFGYYTEDKKHLLIRPNMGRRNEDLNDIVCTAPLYQQAFRWFRENYQDDFYINKWIDDKYWYHVPFLFGSIKERREFRESFETYEEARLECLNKLIEIYKNK
jgi:hypothetical protein